MTVNTPDNTTITLELCIAWKRRAEDAEAKLQRLGELLAEMRNCIANIQAQAKRNQEIQQLIAELDKIEHQEKVQDDWLETQVLKGFEPDK